ncbi:MAG: NAD(P)/FAD-dependent oxidoreductase [Spirochaetes bacterium]|jgi:phytoene dehydrogenase-like protein|nr:NAD(P)/FAD-dependent oxidoreductase [Spirochaetota bacterium]
MMKHWDVIIIGAGYGGLCSGALLAHAGKKVLVLEKENMIGGRAGSIVYAGQYLDDGAHMTSRAGHLEGLFEKIGMKYPDIVPINGSEIYHDGRWKKPRELFSPEMFKKVLTEMMKLSPAQIAELDDIPLNDWVENVSNDPGIKMLFFYLGCSTSVGNRFETYSAGEMIYILREFIDSGRKLSEIGGVIKGGMNGILQPLADYINSHGGEVRLNAPVDSVVIKNGRAVGVNVDTGERLFHGQVLDIETIQAETVIVTLPLWDIFNVLEEDKFPAWWVDWVKWIGPKVSQAWSIIYSLDEPLFDEGVFRWAPNLPESGFSHISFPMPSYGENVKQYQYHVSYQGHWDEMPDLFNRRNAVVKRQVRDTIAMLERESLQLYPQLKSGYHWKVAHAGVYGLAQSPGLVGPKRPSMVPPGIKNLYIVSGTVQEARGISMSAIGKCASMAADVILGGK